MMRKNNIFNAFLISLVIFSGYLCYLIFKPFLNEILVATILVSIFYGLYERLTAFLRGYKKAAALIMCVGIALLVIMPIAQIIYYAAQKSDQAFLATKNFLNNTDFEKFLEPGVFESLETGFLSGEEIRGSLLEMAAKIKDWLIVETGGLLVGTANFIISLFLIFFIMFFFFVDGKAILTKLMHLTPLPNRYDREIFQKFRDVSFSTIVSTIITGIAQGIMGAIAFAIVGLPAFFPGLAMGFLSLLPYVGASLVWMPAGIYLIFVGQIWQGVFMLAWGAAMVSMVDDVLRGYLIKGKARVHPIFVILSIFGGIALFGFWGLFFGPLIISLAATVLHIYEMEYGKVLEK
jgi:predicted PurR-regulated permease PerM